MKGDGQRAFEAQERSVVTIPLAKAQEILAAMEAARKAAHLPAEDSGRFQAMLDLAWQTGVMTFYVNHPESPV
jgi:hypothetical protein